MATPPRKSRTVALEKTRRAPRTSKPREASDDTAPQDVPREHVSTARARGHKPREASDDTAPRDVPQEHLTTAKARGEAVRKKVIAKLKRFHPMD